MGDHLAYSRLNYYADWITLPILMLFALYAAHITPFALAAVAVGAFIWSIAEYSIHRWAFHRLYRKDHWIHHIRPGGYACIPGWQTGLLFAVILGGCWGSFGLDFGGGLFIGMAGGYFTYIWAHDRFHHGRTRPGSYWARREAEHKIHHDSGKEVNFSVVTPLWDMLLRTHQPAE